MLQVHFNKKSYQLPLLNASIDGSFRLDEDWRNLNYKDGGSSLSLHIILNYSVPREYIKAFWEQSLIDGDFITDDGNGGQINEMYSPIIDMHVEINSTDWDVKKNKSIPIGNLGLFFRIKNMEQLKLDEKIVQNATLWFPSFGTISALAEISFGAVAGNSIDVNIAGSSEDLRGKLEFIINEKTVPFAITCGAGGYTDEFKAFNPAQLIEEIKLCVETIYPAHSFDVEDKIIDGETKSVAVVFRESTF